MSRMNDLELVGVELGVPVSRGEALLLFHKSEKSRNSGTMRTGPTVIEKLLYFNVTMSNSLVCVHRYTHVL